jgi:hypothetical protein
LQAHTEDLSRPFSPTMDHLMLQLHPELVTAGKTLYDGFVYPSDLPAASYQDSHVSARLIEALRKLYGGAKPPKFVLEVRKTVFFGGGVDSRWVDLCLQGPSPP